MQKCLNHKIPSIFSFMDNELVFDLVDRNTSGEVLSLYYMLDIDIKIFTT